jgi:hypothetical protein
MLSASLIVYYVMGNYVLNSTNSALEIFHEKNVECKFNSA